MYLDYWGAFFFLVPPEALHLRWGRNFAWPIMALPGVPQDSLKLESLPALPPSDLPLSSFLLSSSKRWRHWDFHSGREGQRGREYLKQLWVSANKTPPHSPFPTFFPLSIPNMLWFPGSLAFFPFSLPSWFAQNISPITVASIFHYNW